MGDVVGKKKTGNKGTDHTDKEKDSKTGHTHNKKSTAEMKDSKAGRGNKVIKSKDGTKTETKTDIQPDAGAALMSDTGKKSAQSHSQSLFKEKFKDFAAAGGQIAGSSSDAKIKGSDFSKTLLAQLKSEETQTA